MGRCEAAHCQDGCNLVDRVYLECGAALLGLVGANIACNQRTVIAVERQIAGCSSDRVRQSKLDHGQSVEYHGVTGVAGDGVAAQAVEHGAQVNQHSNAGIAGDGDSAVKVGIRMVSDFNAAAGVAVDRGDAGPLTVAGLAAVRAEAGIAVDDAVRHQYGAGVDDLQTKRSAVESDLVVAIDVAFRSVEKRDSNSAVMADDVGSSGRAVAAVQDQMGRGSTYSAAPVVRKVDAGVKIKSAAAHTDPRPGVADDGAVGEVDQRVDAGHADAGPVLNGDGIKIDVLAAIDEDTAAAIESDVVADPDAL